MPLLFYARFRSSHIVRLGYLLCIAIFVLSQAPHQLAQAAQAGNARLIKDISTNHEDTQPQIPHNFVTMNGITYFSNFDVDLKRFTGQLWRSDGTAAGTWVVKAFSGLWQRRVPTNLTVVGNTLYFVGWSQETGNELWKSDGTPQGTVIVKDIAPGDQSSFPNDEDSEWPREDSWISEFAASGNMLYFTVLYPDEKTIGLWRTDGTEAGTQRIYPSDASIQTITSLYSFGSKLFFLADQNLWVTDGTAAGTKLLKAVDPDYTHYYASFAVVNQKLLVLWRVTDQDFNAAIELWQSDGTPTGTTRMTAFADASFGTDRLSPMVASGKAAYFTIKVANAERLYATNGTAAGTILLTEQTTVENLANANSILFFTATVGGNTTLWKSTGTVAGTTQVANINTAGTYWLTAINSKAFLCSEDAKSCWVSDGTNAGTTKLSVTLELLTQTFDEHNGPQWLLTAKGLLFATADGSLWLSDGTNAATKSITALPYRNGNTVIYKDSSVVLNNILYFSAGKNELWQSDGTATGTKRFTTANGSIYDIDAFGKQLVFKTSQIDPYRIQLWRSDATGTIQLSSANALVDLVEIGSQSIYFTTRSSSDTNATSDLWRSDGTTAGTKVVKSGLAHVTALKAFGSKAVLLSADQVWISDGTSVSSIKQWLAQSGFSPAVGIVGNTLYFTTPDGSSTSLWKSDGTSAGTTLVTSVPYSQLSLFSADNGLFMVMSGATSFDVWGSDGTKAGTKQLVSFPNMGRYTLLEGAVVGNQFFLSVINATNGMELWRSDGTGQGTILVKDIYPGKYSSIPTNFAALDGKLYFSACDALTGCELWSSDGTESGTKLVSDIMPGPASSEPYPLGIINGEVIANALDNTAGYELIAVQQTALPPVIYAPLVGR